MVDWDALGSAANVGDREYAGDTDVFNDPEFLISDTRLGAQLGRIPSFSSRSGAVLVKRYRITRWFYLVIGRVARIHRWKKKLRRERGERWAQVIHSGLASTIRHALPRNQRDIRASRAATLRDHRDHYSFRNP